jgi:ribA/ribD-fused uncharacterized protein
VSDAASNVVSMPTPIAAGLARTVEELESAIGGDELASYVHFWHGEPRADGALTPDCFSQWWPAAFDQFGVTFATAEHYMMWRKAVLFGDDAAAERVLATPSPSVAKAIGRRALGFDDELWLKYRWGIVVAGTFAKFAAHQELRQFLLATGHAVIVEASPTDTIWGIGLGENDKDAANPGQWRGLNLLGFALMEVRALLRDATPIAAATIGRVPEMYGVRDLVGDRLAREQNGHEFHGGWHVGWAWGHDRGTCFLDLLTEHRHPGMHAERIFADGRTEAIETPGEFRRVGDTPDEDARLERAFLDRNNAAYDSLRQRGLLPPSGANLPSQDINEYCFVVAIHSGAGLRGPFQASRKPAAETFSTLGRAPT